MTEAGPRQRVRFGDVLAVGEFRALWLAELFSQLGDQFARVALAVLVYQQTASAALTGLTYALTYLPSVLGGFTLSWIGDRYPRREVIVVVDLCRAALVALMAVPGTPLAVLCVLLAVMTALGGPFKAAQLALLADVLEGERYVLGLSIRQITIQSAQIGGFLGGGVLAAAVNPSAGLLINALTFVLSAACVGFGMGHRPAAAPGSGGKRSARKPPALAGPALAVLWRDTRLRSLAALSWLAGFYIMPEGLAAPYADSLRVGWVDPAIAVGIIMAADPIGCVIGAFVFGRLIPEPLRDRLLAPLALLAGVPLVLCVLRPGLLVSAVLFGISGALAICYQIQAGARFVRLVPDEMRAQGMGVMSTGLLTVQGLGILAGGVVAGYTGPSLAVALAGTAGILAGARPAWLWTRSAQHKQLVPEKEESR
jgi:MFS family permease